VDERVGPAVELVVEGVGQALGEHALAPPLTIGAAAVDQPVVGTALGPGLGMDELRGTVRADVERALLGSALDIRGMGSGPPRRPERPRAGAEDALMAPTHVALPVDMLR
jgi:hypothetical protein